MAQQFQDSEKRIPREQAEDKYPDILVSRQQVFLPTLVDIKQSDVFLARGNLPSEGLDTTGIISIEAVIIYLSGHQPCATSL